MKPHLYAFLLFVFLLLPIKSSSQIGEYYFGKSGDEFIQSVLCFDDSTFLTARFESGNIFISKFAIPVRLIWDKKIEHNDIKILNEYPCKIKKVRDKLFVCGYAKIQNASDDLGIICMLDTLGNVLRKDIIPKTIRISDIVEGPAGGYYFVGLGTWIGSGTEGVLGYIAEDNTVIWKKYLELYGNCWLKRVFVDTDNNAIVVGRTNTIGTGFEGLVVAKYNKDSTLLWRQLINTDFIEQDPYGEEMYTFPLAAMQDADGSILVCDAASRYNSNSEMLCYSISDNGRILSTKKYYDEHRNECPHDMIKTDDGGMIITGAINTYLNGMLNVGQAYMLRIDSLGKETGRNYFGDVDSTTKLFSIFESDKKFIAFGFSNGSKSVSKKDNFIVVTDSTGNIFPNKIIVTVHIDENRNCVTDPNEQSADKYYLSISGKLAKTGFVSSKENNSFYLPDGEYDLKLLRIDNDSTWETCYDSIHVSLPQVNKELRIQFLVKPKELNCKNLAFSITQADLQRCKVSEYMITVENKGIESVDSAIIEILLEKGLDFISCDRAYNSVNNRYRVSIGKIEALSFQNLRFKVKTSCDAQLAAAHLVKVNLIYPDPCANWNGPEYNIEATCDNDEVVFSVFNNLVENKPRKTNYNVYVNQFLYYSSKDNQSLLEIPSFGDTIQLRYPAKGNTWRLEVFQEQDYPFGSVQSASIESCGKKNTGLHYIGFRNDRRLNLKPSEKEVFSINTTSAVDNTSPAFNGLGYYHIIDSVGYLEFNIRFQNALEKMINKVELDIKFNGTLDLSSFIPVAYCCEYNIRQIGIDRIRVSFENVFLGARSDINNMFYFRFGINSNKNILPDQRSGSYLTVNPSFFLDGEGPYYIPGAYYNYSVLLNEHFDSNKVYDKSIFELLTDGINFPDNILHTKENLLVISSTETFSDNANYELMLYISDKDGIVKEIKPLAELPEGSYYINSVITKDDELLCLLEQDGKVLLKKYTSNGELIWEKKYEPGPNNEPGLVSALDVSDNGIIYIAGNVSSAAGYFVFLNKLNTNGDTIFKKVYPKKGNICIANGVRVMNENTILISSYDDESFPASYVPNSYFIDKDGKLIKIVQASFGSGYNYSFNLIRGEGESCLEIGQFYGSTIAPFIIKYNSNATVQYKKLIPIQDTYTAEFISGVYSPSDTSYYFIGTIRYFDSIRRDFDMLLCKTDLNGNLKWTKFLGNLSTEFGWDISLVNDKLYLLARSDGDEPDYNIQPILLIVALNGDIINSSIPLICNTKSKMKVWPNPAMQFVHIEFPEMNRSNLHWELVDVRGIEYLSGLIKDPKFELNISSLAPGMYFIYCKELDVYSSVFIKN